MKDLTAFQSPSRRWLPLVLTLGTLGAGAGGWVLRQTERGAQATGTPNDHVAVERAIEGLIKDFEKSRTLFPLEPGKTLPALDIPPVPGYEKPLKSTLTLVTFGSEFAPQVKALHRRLEDSIQLVHVIYHPDEDILSPLDMNAVDEFDKRVILLDAASNKTAAIRKILESIGIHRAGYAFLIDGNRKVLYSDNTIGLDTDRLYKVVANTKQPALKNSPRSFENPVKVGERLKIPGEYQKLALPLKKELEKETALVFFSSPSCSICEPWESAATQYVKSWKKAGYGIVFIKADQNTFRVSVDEGGVVYVSDPKTDTPERSVLFRGWNIRTFPSAYILKRGQFQGVVPFLALKVNGRQYFDLQYRAINKLLASSKYW
ncbi:hypothetical protein [Deinococcus sp. RL]|uniref:hypothetical protein n=1 Tax=Deinococcus sp. RL TaxID=1489678 RepID=UPI0012693047|nr:hypothetical protein [Deinococcus sp. RL]